MKMNRLHLISEFVLDIIYGNFCPVCGKAITWKATICSECEKKFEQIKSSACIKCGQIKCRNHDEIIFDNAVNAFEYVDICKEAIYKLKDSGEYNFAKFGSEKITEKLKYHGLSEDIQIITAVPMNSRKKAQRGYNHAEIIAKNIGRLINAKCNFHLLKKVNDKVVQHHLSAEERKTHANSVYSIGSARLNVKDKTVLLVDDVLTTGSTLNACSKLLKDLGAKKVICATIAITP